MCRASLLGEKLLDIEVAEPVFDLDAGSSAGSAPDVSGVCGSNL
jgi:hypothetical protein